MKKPSFLGLVAVILAVTAAPLSANLITNSGFETGDFTGWTTGGFTGVNNFSAHSGNFGAFLGPTEVASSVSQGVSTTAGSLYNVSFWLRCDEIDLANPLTSSPNGFGSFQVFWNGNLILTLPTTAPFAYTQFNFSGLMATGGLTNLQFVLASGSFGFFRLDDVIVDGTVTGVPEPFSTLWLILPLTGMILFRGRSRNSLSRCI
jgi:hypothetical protein